MISREKADKAVDYLCECLCEYSKSKRECRYCKLGAVRARVEEIPYDDNPTVTHGEGDSISLICLRCKKVTTYSMSTFREISYTHYSYCEECLRAGLKLLREADKEEKDDD